MLLDAGAYINPMESNGGRLTPLDYALINNHSDVARLLVCFLSFSLSLRKLCPGIESAPKWGKYVIRD